MRRRLIYNINNNNGFAHEVIVSMTYGTINTIPLNILNDFCLKVVYLQGECSLNVGDYFYPYKDKSFYINNSTKIIFNVCSIDGLPKLTIDSANYNSDVPTGIYGIDGECGGSTWSMSISNGLNSTIPEKINMTLSLKEQSFTLCSINYTCNYTAKPWVAYIKIAPDNSNIYNLNNNIVELSGKSYTSINFYMPSGKDSTFIFDLIGYGYDVEIENEDYIKFSGPLVSSDYLIGVDIERDEETGWPYCIYTLKMTLPSTWNPSLNAYVDILVKKWDEVY